jgi:hypothetical protein
MQWAEYSHGVATLFREQMGRCTVSSRQIHLSDRLKQMLALWAFAHPHRAYHTLKLFNILSALHESLVFVWIANLLGLVTMIAAAIGCSGYYFNSSVCWWIGLCTFGCSVLGLCLQHCLVCFVTAIRPIVDKLGPHTLLWYFEQVKSRYTKVLKVLALIGTLTLAYKYVTYKKTPTYGSTMHTGEGSKDDTPEDDIGDVARDLGLVEDVRMKGMLSAQTAEVTNIWKQDNPLALPTTEASTTTVRSTVHTIARRSMARVEVVTQHLLGKHISSVSAVCLAGNVWAFPQHVLGSPQKRVSIVMLCQMGDVVQTIKLPLDIESIATFHADLCYTTLNTPTLKGIAKFCMPKDQPFGPYLRRRRPIIVHVQRDAGFQSFAGFAVEMRTIVTDLVKVPFPVVWCESNHVPVCEGMCGSVVVDAQTGVVLGLVVASETRNPLNFMFSVVQPHRVLELKSCMLQTHRHVDYPRERFELPIIDDETNIHRRSPFVHAGPLFPFLGLSTDPTSGFPPFGANIIGSFGEPMKLLRTEAKHSLAHDQYLAHFDLPEVGAPTWVARKDEEGKYPFLWQLLQPDALQLARVSHCSLITPFQHAKGDYLASILPLVGRVRDEGGWYEPLTFKQSYEGIPGLYGVDAINFASSCGIPLNMKKANLFPMDDDGNRVPDDRIFEQYTLMLEALRNGERSHFLFKASIKDEITGPEKKKSRLFYACDLVSILITRTYFAPLIRFFMLYPLDCESAVGINVFSIQWTDLATHLKTSDESDYIAGDYGDFDRTIPRFLLLIGYDILVEMARVMGASPEHLVIIKGICTDIIYANIHYDGVIVEASGGNASGNALTVFINGLVVSLLKRAAYYFYGGKLPFKASYRMITYGDDHIVAKKRHEAPLTGERIRDFVKEHCDMKYTRSDKTAMTNTDQCFGEIDFVKRPFVWNDELCRYCAPLPFKSLHKMMTWTLSGDLDKHLEGSVMSYVNEMLQHPRAVYDEYVGKLRRVLRDIPNAIIGPSWLEYMDDMKLEWDYDVRWQRIKETDSDRLIEGRSRCGGFG